MRWAISKWSAIAWKLAPPPVHLACFLFFYREQRALAVEATRESRDLALGLRERLDSAGQNLLSTASDPHVLFRRPVAGREVGLQPPDPLTGFDLRFRIDQRFAGLHCMKQHRFARTDRKVVLASGRGCEVGQACLARLGQDGVRAHGATAFALRS